MMKFDQILMASVKANIKTNKVPMLLGEPGIGKSSWVESLAELMRTKCFTLPCNQLADKADLTGARLVPTDNGEYKQVFYPHAIICDAIKYAEDHPRETPILFLDELNRTTSDITSEALSIPTLRSIGNSKLPNNLRVIVAGNDKGNITALDEASVSRFILYHVTPDVSTFLAYNPNINPFIKNVLTAHPECLFCKQIITTISTGNNDDDDNNDVVNLEEILDDGEEMAQITTPRTITALSCFLNEFNNTELMSLLNETTKRDDEDISMLQEIVEGHVGRTLFTTHLMAEIASNILSTNNQSTVTTVAKPACYDDMKKCTDVTSLNDFFSNLSDNDKSGIMLYALYEKVDNKIYIETLASHITSLMPNDSRTLMGLWSTDELDTENVQAVLNTNTPLANIFSMLM